MGAIVREQHYGSNITGARCSLLYLVTKNNDNAPPPLTKSEVRTQKSEVIFVTGI
ncbi:MAG: hypothetical protein F6K39_31080 [Okeania sp. SIO3B3]|nr:hypothetical protein [Okeania sp. SIO3B3]